jgi:cell division protein FtsL
MILLFFIALNAVSIGANIIYGHHIRQLHAQAAREQAVRAAREEALRIPIVNSSY